MQNTTNNQEFIAVRFSYPNPRVDLGKDNHHLPLSRPDIVSLARSGKLLDEGCVANIQTCMVLATMIGSFGSYCSNRGVTDLKVLNK